MCIKGLQLQKQGVQSKLQLELQSKLQTSYSQRRSQVSLAGGGADRIPGGGINLNTYTYKMSRQAA